MKKIFTLFCMMLLAVQFAAAQKTLYVISKDGKLWAYFAKKITFDLFTFTYGDMTEITKESFSASFNVAFKSDEYKRISLYNGALEVGICISDVNDNPTIFDGKIEKGSMLSEHSFSIYGLDAGTTYYYRAYVKVNDAVYYGDVCNVTTYGKKIANNYKIINGHKFVDLGLPSGLLWATCNVGAATAAYDGCYFTWGETDMTTNSSYYNWNTYKYGTSSSNFTKYNSTDGKATLDKEDDAAYVNWGDSCRMPTNYELTELCDSDNCTWTWTSMTISDGSSIYGYKVTSVKNGNSIFLPASGYRSNGMLDSHYSSGSYWSNTLGSSNSEYACYLNFDSDGHSQSNKYRYYGYTIRPVAEP